MRTMLLAGALGVAAAITAIGPAHADGSSVTQAPGRPADLEARLAKYATVRLTADTSALTPQERRMIPLLIDAAREMDDLFWLQAYGDRGRLAAAMRDADLRRYLEINYGPWDRLEENAPFLAGVGPKRPGAELYPADMTKEEFDAAIAAAPEKASAFKSLYTVIRRDPGGKLMPVPYSTAFAEPLRRAALKLRQAAELAEDPGLKRYLALRAEALLSDDYQPSDLAWMDMKDNTLDIVIGPIESYEDQLFGYKASYEGYVLVKDKEWSRRLARYVALLPDLQRGLPVPEAYKRETPGAGSDLNAYDAVFYAGDCNAGAKTIAINLPNDEQVQLEKGTRRLQLKNAMRAKFDKVLVPVAQRLIVADQRSRVTFDAFFANVMFHEVAHGLGIKSTLDGKGSVREALKDQFSGLEEGKADVLGLYMVSRLQKMKELEGADLRDNYVSFVASIFRSIRFGAADAHGRANAAQFSFLRQAGAITRDAGTGTYRVDFDKMGPALDALSEKILRFQGDGDRDGVAAFMESMGRIDPDLRADLDGLASAGIPVDIVFEQGMQVLSGGR